MADQERGEQDEKNQEYRFPNTPATGRAEVEQVRESTAERIDTIRSELSRQKGKKLNAKQTEIMDKRLDELNQIQIEALYSDDLSKDNFRDAYQAFNAQADFVKTTYEDGPEARFDSVELELQRAELANADSGKEFSRAQALMNFMGRDKIVQNRTRLGKLLTKGQERFGKGAEYRQAMESKLVLYDQALEKKSPANYV